MSSDTTTATDTTWKVRVAMRCWAARQMTWTEMQAVVTEAGMTSEQACAVAQEVGV